MLVSLKRAFFRKLPTHLLLVS